MTSDQIKVPLVTPEWFKLLAPDALLNAKDVALLFGLSVGSLANGALEKFPKSDFVLGKNKQWKKSTILKELKHRQKCKLENKVL